MFREVGSWGKGAWGLAVPPNTGRRWREETPWDLPVDTELQVLHAWGDPDKALTAAPHPAMRQPSPCLALQLPRAHTPHSPGPAPRGHCRPPRPPQAPMVGTLTFHPKFTMQVTGGTPRGCSPPRRPPPLPPARPPAPLTCLSRPASWSWVLPDQEASSSSSSLFPRRCWGTAG